MEKIVPEINIQKVTTLERLGLNLSFIQPMEHARESGLYKLVSGASI